MKKRLSGLILFIIICVANVSVVSAACAKLTAKTEADGREVSFTGFEVDGRKLIRVWDLAGILKNTVCMCDLSWSVEDHQIILTPMCNYSGKCFDINTGAAVPSYSAGVLYLNYNGTVTEIPSYLIEGNNYVEMDALGDIMGYEVRTGDNGNLIELSAGGSVFKQVRINRNTFEGSKCIALTFDDGPMKGSTERILAALDKVGGHATFFVVGEMVDEYPYLVRSIVEQGSQIGNHTYSHEYLSGLSDEGIQSQVNRTSNSVYAAAGVYPYIGRPPYGAINQVVKAATNIDWYTWNVDTLDWKYRDSEYVYNYVMENAKDGDVILMHDLHPTTATAMERAIPDLAAKGFKLVTIDELADAKGGKEKINGYYK